MGDYEPGYDPLLYPNPYWDSAPGPESYNDDETEI